MRGEISWQQASLLWSLFMLSACAIVCVVSSYREKRRRPSAWDRHRDSLLPHPSTERQVPRQ